MALPSKMPYDKQSAKEALKYFTDLAYSHNHKGYFEKAISILYGENFKIKLDLSNRMSFSCLLCSKDMNNETAVAQHNQSGSHLKNLDKSMRDQKSMSSASSNLSVRLKYGHIDDSHRSDSKSFYSMLKTSAIKPLGLQMIEEYQNSSRWSYYKCNLCGAHGKLDSMYKHVIGNKHTERYIKSRINLRNSILTSKEREFIREFLVEKEGLPPIIVYRDKSLYPRKWEKCHLVQDKKEIKRSLSPSLSRSPSINSPSYSTKSLDNHCSQPSTSTSYKNDIRREREAYPDGLSDDESSHKRLRITSPMSIHRNQSPPGPSSADDTVRKGQTTPPPPPKKEVTRQNQFTQKYDLDELMIQLNYIVKTSSLSSEYLDFHIRSPDDAKATLDMMFKLSSAIHAIMKSKIVHSSDQPQDVLDNLNQRKNLLSKIMGSIKMRMQPGLLRKSDSK